MSGRHPSENDLRVRLELRADAAAVHEVVARAFPTDAEARLVARLREVARPQISVVAIDASGRVIGHVLFTPVEILAAEGASRALGLAPLAVRPEHQRRGVGSALVRAGLAECREIGEPVVVVLGHPGYYPRFGFRPAWELGLYYRRPGPEPSFLVAELEPRALRGRRGEVRYHPAFSDL